MDDSVSPELKMASAVVGQAIKDLRHKEVVNMTDHVDAVCWLVSKAGIKWFDAARIDQASALSKIRWDVYAKDILSDDEASLSDDQRKMLASMIKHFQCWHKESDYAWPQGKHRHVNRATTRPWRRECADHG